MSIAAETVLNPDTLTMEVKNPVPAEFGWDGVVVGGPQQVLSPFWREVAKETAKILAERAK